MSAHGKSFETKVQEAIEAIPGRSFGGLANTLSLAGMAFGVVALGYGLGTGKTAWTLGALLVAVFWSFCLAQGGVAFAFILHGTQARWGRPLKRIGESFAFYLPVAWALLLGFFLIGGLQIYEWNPDTIVVEEAVSLAPHMEGAAHAKEFWLTPMFFAARQLVVMGILILINFLFVRNSLGGDLVKARQVLGSNVPAWWARFTPSGSDPVAAAEKGQNANYTLVPIMGFVYAIGMSLLAFDLLMSLDAWWFSNMFGGWVFMSTIWLGMAGIAATAMLGRDWLSMRDWVTPNVTHDLGKLMLAGCMFWAYTLFAQILPIWYTNVPEETNFLLVRMTLPQWSWLARTVAVLCFLAPFTISLSRGIKKMRWPFFGLASLIMFGLFLERTLLVMPSVYRDAAFPTVDFVIINFGLLAGVLGAFVAVVGRVLASVPAVPITDEMLDEHPWDVHVHAAGGHEASAH